MTAYWSIPGVTGWNLLANLGCGYPVGSAYGSASYNTSNLGPGYYNVAFYFIHRGGEAVFYDGFYLYPNYDCSDSGNYCAGQLYYNRYGNACTGTKVCCTDTSWTPDPSTECVGTSFTQTSNCGTTRTNTGTKISSSGQCGSAANQAWDKKPDSNLCSLGTASDPTVSGGDWTWICEGPCGGAKTSCFAQRDLNWKEVAP